MKILKGKTAVITGAGSGIGAATAVMCAKKGMNVVISDIHEENLLSVEQEIKNIGVEVLSVKTDVSDSSQIQLLATKTYSVFKSVELLFNNAGVLHVAPLLKHTENDWQWVLSVNLFGVINSVRIFTPLMCEQKTESHIVNTASLGGFTTGAGLAAYKTSKHAVIAFSEVLEAELVNTQVKVSVLCPGWTNTKIMKSEFARPNKYKNYANQTENTREDQMHILKGTESAKKGQSPEFIAECVLNAVINNKFYIIPDNSFHDKFNDRITRILES